MKRKPLQVTLSVREPSVIELTVEEKVQLDRLAPSNHGHVAQRHGSLLDRGATTLSLDPGSYFFRTLSDARLKTIRGGVAALVATLESKDDPPEHVTVGSPPQPETRGDDASGDAPILTLE